MAKYTLMGGKIQFGSLEDKETFILKGVLMDIDYILEKSKLSWPRKEVLRCSRRDLAKLIKQREKRSGNKV